MARSGCRRMRGRDGPRMRGQLLGARKVRTRKGRGNEFPRTPFFFLSVFSLVAGASLPTALGDCFRNLPAEGAGRIPRARTQSACRRQGWLIQGRRTHLSRPLKRSLVAGHPAWLLMRRRKAMTIAGRPRCHRGPSRLRARGPPWPAAKRPPQGQTRRKKMGAWGNSFPPAFAYRTGRSQISSAYSRMVRSEENHATRAVFITALRHHSDGRSHLRATRCWAAT